MSQPPEPEIPPGSADVILPLPLSEQLLKAGEAPPDPLPVIE